MNFIYEKEKDYNKKYIKKDKKKETRDKKKKLLSGACAIVT